MGESTVEFKQRVWFITGASTGFGLILAEQLLRRGDKVVATARKPEGKLANLGHHYADRALVLPLDVNDAEQVNAAVEQTLAKFGRVDVLVNNAGYGLLGAIEEVTDAELMPMFETNVFGLLRVTKAFLPQLRKQRSGHIVNLSSIGGLIGIPGWGYYNASKFGVEGLSEALAFELEPLGIHVTIVEPGPFRTDFLGRSAQEAEQKIADYDATVGKTREYLKTNDGKQVGDPVRAIKVIIAAVDADKPPRHLLLGRNAIDRYRAKIKNVEAEIAEWEAMSLDTDFREGE